MEGDATIREGCEGIVGSLICEVGGSEGSEGVGDGVREDVDENVETRRECVILFIDDWRIQINLRIGEYSYCDLRMGRIDYNYGAGSSLCVPWRYLSY